MTRFLPRLRRIKRATGKNFWQQTLLLALAVLAIATPAASALSQEQQDVYDKGVYYFDAETCTVSLDGSSVSLLGSDNIEKAYNFFVSNMGYTPQQAAGAVGSMTLESHLSPTATNGGSGAYGIAQWLGPRLTNLKQLEGNNYNTLAGQIAFVQHELKGDYKSSVNDAIKKAKTYEDAQKIWTWYYEGLKNYPDQWFFSTRNGYALDILNKYSGNSVTASGITTDASADSCATGSQYSGNGFPLYSQCDPKWGSDPYWGNDICGAGCGPTSMAMIITALTGQSVTPDVVANFFTSKGLQGSWGAAEVAADHWGLKSQPLGIDVAKISAAVQSGSLVIMAGQGGLPFTTEGHFVIVRGVTSDGKWILGDPDTAQGHSNTKPWDPATVIAGVVTDKAQSSVVAISK